MDFTVNYARFDANLLRLGSCHERVGPIIRIVQNWHEEFRDREPH